MKIFTEKPDNDNTMELLKFCCECAETLTLITLKLKVLEGRLIKLDKYITQ